MMAAQNFMMGLPISKEDKEKALDSLGIVH